MTPLFIKRLVEARESGTHGLVALALGQTYEFHDILRGKPPAEWRELLEQVKEVENLLADPLKSDGTPIPDMDVIAEHLAVEGDKLLSAMHSYWTALSDVLDAVDHPDLPTVQQQIERWKVGQRLAAIGREHSMERMVKRVLRAGRG